MNAAVLRRLLAKEWYFFRWAIAGSIGGGLAALALASLGGQAYYFGSISFMVVVIVHAALLASFGVLEERKNRNLLFVLTLPISPVEYARAKLLANGSAFFVPWLVLSVAAHATIALSDLPDGLIPFTAALMGCILLYYAAMYSVAFAKGTQSAMTAAIVLGSVAINFFIFLVGGLPSVRENMRGPQAVWGADLVAVIAGEYVLAAACIALAFHFYSRKKDFT